MTLFLSCNEDIKYASSDPSNCTAEFCEEDFDEGSGLSTDTGNASINEEDTADGQDSADEEDSGGPNNDEPQDTGEGNQDDSDHVDEQDTGYEHEDSGFHKGSEECGCANPEGSLSFFIFFSFFGFLRRNPSNRPA